MTSNYQPQNDGAPYGRAVAGPVRTAVQLVPSAVITEVVDVFIYDFDERQYAAFAALLLLGFSWIQNFIESRKGVSFLSQATH